MRFWLSGPRIMGVRPGVSFDAKELFDKPKKVPPETPAATAVGGFIYLLCGIVFFIVAIIVISSAGAHAGGDAKAKQHLNEFDSSTACGTSASRPLPTLSATATSGRTTQQCPCKTVETWP
jgi:hypothetical protein